MKKYGLIILIIVLFVLSQLVTIPLYFNKKLGENVTRNLMFDMNTFVFNHNLAHKFNINIDSAKILNNIKIKKDVDVLMINHFSSIDFMLTFYLLNCVQRRDIILVLKKQLLYIPILGNLLSSDGYIKLNRSWEYDKHILEEKISKLKNGIIIIFPEGTRFCKETYEKSKKYCKENNLICNKKLLIPKVKGLFNIVNILKKNNMMGNLYDLSSVIPDIMNNFHNVKYDYFKLFSVNISESYHYIRQLKIPDYYYDYDTFKNWLYHQWNTKDLFITNYSNYKYKRLVGKYDKKNITTCYVLIIIYIYLTKNYPYHTSGSFLISYIFTVMKTLLS